MTLDQLLNDWKEAHQLANALYGMYKDQRQRQESFESQIKELIERKPLSNNDWIALRRKVEQDENKRTGQ